MKKFIPIFLLVSLFCIILFTKAESSSLKDDTTPVEQPTACFSLDVVFIIDQSDSMSGSGGAPASDSIENRVYAPRWAIDYLTDNAFDICPDAIHRVAMVSFGDEVEPDLEFNEINPESEEQAKNTRDRLKNKIAAKRLGQTDPKKAFEIANNLLDEYGPIENSGARKRVIIFMTDGEPCVSELGCLVGHNTMDFIQYSQELQTFAKDELPFDPVLLKQEECLRDAREKYEGEDLPGEVVNQCLEDYRVDPQDYQKSNYIFTMLLRKGTAYPSTLTEIYEDMSEEHGGELISLQDNRNDITKTFLDILTRMSGVKASRISCGNIAMNPFLRSARIIFFKIDPEIPVRILYSDNEGTHVVENGIYDGDSFEIKSHYSEGANERYEFLKPYPGIWTIESDACEGIDAYFEPVDFEVGDRVLLSILAPDQTLIKPEATLTDLVSIPKFGQEPYYNKDQAYHLQYELLDRSGDIIPEKGGDFFHVQWTINITDPTGNVESYPLFWDASTNTYRTAKESPLKLPVQGDYSLQVSADVVQRETPYFPIDRNAKDEDVFTSSRHLFDEEASFKVVCPNLALIDRCPWDTRVVEDGCLECPLKSFKVEILSPENGANIGAVHGTIKDDWPLPVQPFDVRFQIVGSGGEVINLSEVLKDTTHPVVLKVEGGGSPRTIDDYIAEIENPGVYKATVKDFDYAGNYKLTAELSSGYSEFWFPAKSMDERVFRRLDGPWNTESTYRMLLYVLIVLLVIFVLYSILIRTNPVRGSLIFTHYDGEEIARLPLKSDKNWKVIGARQLNVYPQLDLKKIKVTNIGKASKKRAATEEDVLATIDGGALDPTASVRVEFTSKSSGRFSENLQSGNPVPFSAHGEENLFQMEYRKEGY